MDRNEVIEDAKAALAEKYAVFMDEAAHYFERRPTQGEDAAFWANVNNAETCRRISAFLRSHTK